MAFENDTFADTFVLGHQCTTVDDACLFPAVLNTIVDL